MNAFAVLGIALLTALATGLGALPVLAFGSDERRAAAISSALAAGAMLGASIGLFYEGLSRSVGGVALGALVGVCFIVVSGRLLGHTHDAHIGELRGARGLTALMVIGVMTVHSFTEGAAVGVSFAGEESLGIAIAIAIAVHNIPEGVAISLVLLPFGATLRSAVGWSIFSSLPQPLTAVPAFLAVSAFEPLLPAGLGFAGGAMTWMVVTHLLPDALEAGSRQAGLVAMALSATAMIAFEFAIGF
ncbi:MAG: ZIP family metal transporter [Actinomycetota bacterium]